MLGSPASFRTRGASVLLGRPAGSAAALLDVCDIMFVEDPEGAYHLSIFAGCTGKPFWSRVFTIDEHGQVVQQWRLVMGCDPFTCLGLCGKAMSGFCIDSFV